MNKCFMLTIALASMAFLTACDHEDDLEEDFRGEYVCHITEMSEDGKVLAVECPGLDGAGPLANRGGSCYGELMCCDTVTLGCFCADTEHGAVCPSGTVHAPD